MPQFDVLDGTKCFWQSLLIHLLCFSCSSLNLCVVVLTVLGFFLLLTMKFPLRLKLLPERWEVAVSQHSSIQSIYPLPRVRRSMRRLSVVLDWHPVIASRSLTLQRLFQVFIWRNKEENLEMKSSSLSNCDGGKERSILLSRMSHEDDIHVSESPCLDQVNLSSNRLFSRSSQNCYLGSDVFINWM